MLEFLILSVRLRATKQQLGNAIGMPHWRARQDAHGDPAYTQASARKPGLYKCLCGSASAVQQKFNKKSNWTVTGTTNPEPKGTLGKQALLQQGVFCKISTINVYE